MSDRVLTVEAVAGRLQVHPRTVLRFIRDGRLRATRIGKSWRILGSDLDAFSGIAARPGRDPPRVTAIADLASISVEVAQRIATALQAAALSTAARDGPVRLDTAYDPERSLLKVIIVGDIRDTAALLQMLDGFAGAFR